MKILYVAYVRLPTEKAHGLQIMKVCEALAKAGADVELLIPGRATTITEDPFGYYGVERVFTITPLPGLDLMRLGRFGFVLSQILFGQRVARYAAALPQTVVISQDEWTLGSVIHQGYPCVYEVHNGRSNPAAQKVAHRARLIVANSHGTKTFYVDQGIPEERILVLANGVDLARFTIPETTEEAREKLGLPKGQKLILYTGHLYDWKGAGTLARAAQELPEGVTVVCVGGTESDVAAFRACYESQRNLLLVGHKPNRHIPLYLRAADVLVLPNDRIGESERFTSPMKLFEYLAAGKPIVASDLPSIREVVDESSAFLFMPGDKHDLAAAIRSALENTDEAARRAAHARVLAGSHTWDRSSLLARLSTLL